METQILETKEIVTEKKLDEAHVIELYDRCILGDSDFDSAGLTCNFAIGEGVSSRCVFSCERLNDSRKELASFIEQLLDIDQGPSLMKLYYDQNGNKWTDSPIVMEMLVQMGTASNMISLLYPAQVWHLLPGGVPCVGKTLYTENDRVRGIDSDQYVKVFGSNK